MLTAVEAGYRTHWTPFSVTMCVISIIFALALFFAMFVLTLWWCVDRNGRNMLEERANRKQKERDEQNAHEERMAELEAQKYQAMASTVAQPVLSRFDKP